MNKQCRCGPEGCADSSCAGRSVMQSNEFEAWYDTVVKYVEPADIAAWMYDAWDAGRASAPAPVVPEQPVAWMYKVGGRLVFHTSRYDFMYHDSNGNWIKGIPLTVMEQR